MAFRVFPQLRLSHNKEYWPEQGDITVREGAVNCGAAGGAGLANYGQTKTHLTHHAMRLKAGNPGFYRTVNGERIWIPTGLSTSSLVDALKGLGCDAERKVGTIWDATAALKDGHAVGFAVDYPTINAYRGGVYSGDRRFDGPHFLVCKGWKREGGINYTGDWDSTLDGRDKAYNILTAPVWVPFRMIRLAAGNFRVGGVLDYPKGTPIGDNKGIFIIVKGA